MYGRQSEIQRIQLRLQRIGNANPYRSWEGEVQRAGDGNRTGATPPASPTPPSQVRTTEEENTPLSSTVIGVQPFMSTRDRYKTTAGQQALREMEKVANLPDPLPDAVTFAPQSSWPQQVSVVDDAVRHSSHELADALRQQRYTHASCGYGDHTVGAMAENPQEYGKSGDEDFLRSTIRPHLGNDWTDNAVIWSPAKRFRVIQGAVWFVGAVVARMVIDRLLTVFPGLWIVMAAMVLTPVAIALYQTAVNPKSTVHSGRRLLVIMMGLLIGGQL